MTGSILIENLRNISRFEFPLPQSGVWILTAGNGAGKTTLLACLRRIGQSNAFQTHFRSSTESETLDNFSSANITYSIGGASVEYAYRGERWTPRPRTNSHLLRRFGYPNVLYIGATAERLTPRPEDFNPRQVKSASATLKDGMNGIFETDKFNNLCSINITKGSGNQIFLMKHEDGSFHSEKNFSLGELCILKMLREINECPNKSLLLIDELEIALHPRAQVQLVDYLSNIAAQKSLTVIFSTHSVSILKAAPHRRIICLEKDDDNVVIPILGCFPTYAIGRITLGEETTPDVVLYVEDDVARRIVTPLSKLVMQRKYADSENLFPSLKIVPIGPFANVVRFLAQHNALLPAGTKAHAVLDQDVKAETVAGWHSHNNYPRLASFQAVEKQICYLPWTPEVAIVGHLAARRAVSENAIKKIFSLPHFTLKQNIFIAIHGLTGKPLRDAAKSIYAELCESLRMLSAKPTEYVEDKICEYFAVEYFKENDAVAMQLFAPRL